MRRFRDISITRKLYFTVGLMAVLIAVELTTLWFSVHTLSAVRALVAGEGLWSKAEKDAIFELRKYGETHDEKDYQSFIKFMAVPLGDHKTRMELFKPKPDMDVARKGFLEGRNHKDDIDGMIQLVMRFHDIYYIRKAIEMWSKADVVVARFQPLAEKMHNEINSANPSQAKINILLTEIDPLNKELTRLEDEFSFTLGAGSRWLENLVLKLLFAVALTVEVSGLLLTVSVSRGISKGLNEINRAALKIKKGDLSDRAHVLAKDEIGSVAQTINQMTDQLIRSNQELSQFAYIASHDLQEPLRTISNFSGLLADEYKEQLHGNGEQYLEFIRGAATRMQALMRDLLEYSRIGADNKKVEVDCNLLLKEILADIDSSVEESKAVIQIEKLPLVYATHDFKLLWQNLLSNAIKYRDKQIPLQIIIKAEDADNNWLFSINDNGIGIQEEYYERIFVIFQKLHNRREYEGSGIGLAQCKKIVELNNGNIWVKSAPGKGSTFYFTIPKEHSDEPKTKVHPPGR